MVTDGGSRLTNMGIEIERKFLVTGDDWRASKFTHYCQGYLNSDIHRTVRVRIAGDRSLLTVKSLATAVTRVEFEYAIPLTDARQMLQICEQPLIEKNRHVVRFAGFDWEIDEFLGDNQGLIVAEIELETENQSFEIPPWVGQEVTDDLRYLNSRLAKTPFKNWS